MRTLRVRHTDERVAAAAAQLGAHAIGLGVVAHPVFLHELVLRRAGGVAGRVKNLRRLQLRLHGGQSPHAGTCPALFNVMPVHDLIRI